MVEITGRVADTEFERELGTLSMSASERAGEHGHAGKRGEQTVRHRAVLPDVVMRCAAIRMQPA
jgi:hypothetical protein